jgi:hypothetical protein
MKLKPTGAGGRDSRFVDAENNADMDFLLDHRNPYPSGTQAPMSRC